MESQYRVTRMEPTCDPPQVELSSLALVLSQIHDSIIVTDLNGTITQWNHGAEKIFGYEAAEVLGQNVTLLYCEEDRPTVLAKVLNPLKEAGALEIELRNRRKSGEDCHIRLSLSLLHDEENRPYGMMGVATDLTEQRRAEEALRRSEERYRSLVDALPNIAFITDANGKTVFINHYWEKYSGSLAEDSHNLDWLAWVHPEDVPGLSLSWMNSVKAGTPHEYEYRIKGADAEYRWHISRTIPLRDGNGNVYQWIGAATDIHERKQRESQRASLESNTLQAILENLTEGILIAKPDGTVLLMNHAAQQMYRNAGAEGHRMQLQDLLKTVDAATLDGDQLAHDERPISRAVRGDAFYDLLTRFRDRATGRQWIGSCASTPVRSSSGELALVVLSIRDVTSERKSAEEVAQANQVLRLLSGQLLRLQDEERKRIARELHDGTVQILSAAIMNLTLLADSECLTTHEFERRLIGKTLELNIQSATELRTLSYLLHPPALDELGLEAALRSWVDGFSERTQIHVDLKFFLDGPRLTPETETALFRITQEALANVHRHSGSPSASVQLSARESSVDLTIHDEGCGFDAAKAFTGVSNVRLGVGLPGIRERARLMGGVMEITSTPEGTTVRVSLPRKNGSG